ncbi:Glycosyl hydrolases family 28 [Filimonas lacunae]|uniref:Glycosyl hydrolases family 28 n=1 Tax=Filimonas lacunae TaxID=477680 RepID=A0A173MQR1_9BACT|nr:glycosyl hydrolase family 28 protein [Filimonas lacunae]BAV09678.1 exopolygalacturonase precursor [Filimonas lacunae]SIS77111.1 Glycosyl hydrolases family 28 [Filimonas lacunae]
MIRKKKWLSVLFALTTTLHLNAWSQELFPDGTPIPEWFRDNTPTNISKLGKRYSITDYSVVKDSTVIQTQKIQAVIDKAFANGGGVVVVPKGTFLTGALFFKQGTHLHLEEGAKLKGSDDISNFPIRLTRMEGQTLKYFTALINADSLNGFTISGKGTLDGNGLRYWKSFWLRREFNPKTTNMDEMRPRLLYVSNSKNVQISGVKLINSPFWTSHYYKCENVKLLDLHIFSPKAPVKAPSTDAVDIDGCKNFLIKNCYMSVNDDAVALKGGKGPTADKEPNNGSNENIIIEDCTYGFCHGALTFGSESIHDRNIILRRIKINNAERLLWLKMRPDTPQDYEYVVVENIEGSNIENFIFVRPWTQFFDLKGEKATRQSYCKNITMRNINLECNNFFNVGIAETHSNTNAFEYQLSDFTFENLTVKAKNFLNIDTSIIKNFQLKNVIINGEKRF